MSQSLLLSLLLLDLVAKSREKRKIDEMKSHVVMLGLEVMNMTIVWF